MRLRWPGRGGAGIRAGRVQALEHLLRDDRSRPPRRWSTVCPSWAERRTCPPASRSLLFGPSRTAIARRVGEAGRMATLEALSSAGVHPPRLLLRLRRGVVETLVPFVLDGLIAEQPVAVAVPKSRMRLLHDVLGDAAPHVAMLRHAGRRPQPRPDHPLPAAPVHRHPRQRPREHHRRTIWADRTDAEYPACSQHEALINLAFTRRDVTVLCPYDTSTRAPCSPTLRCSTAPNAAPAAGTTPTPSSAGTANRSTSPLIPKGFPVTATADIRGARGFAVARAQRLGLAAERVADLEPIATELVTNGLRHTGAGYRLMICHDNGQVVCAVEDSGHLGDPLVGARGRSWAASGQPVRRPGPNAHQRSRNDVKQVRRCLCRRRCRRGVRCGWSRASPGRARWRRPGGGRRRRGAPLW